MPTLEARIGRRILAARVERDLPLERCATRLALLPYELSQLESGRAPLTAVQLWTMATYFEKPLSWFFTGP